MIRQTIRPPKVTAKDIIGMPEGGLLMLSHPARCALGFAIKHRWRVVMLTERVLKCTHPLLPDGEKLLTLEGLGYTCREVDWKI